MESIKCVIKRIRHHNHETGFTVAVVQHGEGRHTAVGLFSDIREGMTFQMSGEWTEHPAYGCQFKCSSAMEIRPETKKGMETYLGSGLIKGIGPRYAGAIVEMFGTDTFDVIDNHPEKLLSVRGIGTGRVNRIIESWNEQKEVRNIMMYLQSVGVSAAYAVKIYKKFGKWSIERVKENPYCLTQIWGIGFKIADGIALNMGFAPDSAERCKSGILYVMDTFMQQGHVYADKGALERQAQAVLGLPDAGPVAAALEMLLESDALVRESINPDAVYQPKFLRAESYVARKLRELAKPTRICPPSAQAIGAIERKLGVVYDECQREAIRQAAVSRLMILTGGPGTGKTTTVNGILAYYQGRRILLAAPTGRAAKRMSEVTGAPAQTIHRLLEYGPGGMFSRNEENPLEGDVLIVDESSMLDILLMESLLRAVPKKMTVVFAGDVDQLPSVGPGAVLKDMIDSHVLPVVRLTKIFRQAQTSDIVMNAHRINRGEPLVITNRADSDFFWCVKDDPQSVQDEIIRFVSVNLPRYYHVKPTDIQVLSPMRKGMEGTDALNQRLQEAVNPDAEGIPFGQGVLRVNDKVMQLKNNYEKNVFNGDVGFVSGFDHEENTVSVNYDGHRVEYERSNLNELTLAYACTVHKSQGSEYPIVVMPVTTSHTVMLERNLLYTAVTRAKKVFVAVGSQIAMNMAISRMRASKRNTVLADRLKWQPQ